LNRQDVQNLIDHVAQTNGKVVEELIPALLNVGQVQKVLQNLLAERVSIRDLLTILETLADYAALTKDPDLLTEYVRQKLSRSILHQYETQGGELPILTLGQDIEDQLANSITDTEQGSYLALDPELGQKVLTNLSRAIEKMAQMNIQPVLLCSPVVRRHLRKLTERFIPNLVVLSHNEITPTTQLNVMGEVGLSNAG
jgi:flagellar biosynthesis protein FlhA